MASIIVNPKFTEKEWIIQMEHNLAIDLDALAQTPVSIFQVPESLRVAHRHAYSPHLLALGPYHHWNPHLYTSQTFKLAAAKRAHQHLRLPDLRHFVAALSRLLPLVRASYDRHLHMTDQALAWILAVDALFLLHLLYSLSDSPQSHTPPLFHNMDRTLLLTDAVLLENQIPMFLLHHILTGSDSNCGSIASVSVDFCRKLSPLELADPDPEHLNPRHLLDLLYHLIIHTNHNKSVQHNGNGNGVILPPETKSDPDLVGRVSDFFQSWLRKISEEETAGVIPTATQLRNAGMKLGIAKQGIGAISFDKDTKTLKLPVFTWKPNCEVVLRNLVAYEAVAEKPDRLVLGRYADVMNAICRTAEDAKLLEEEGIIKMSSGGGSDVVLVWEVFGGHGMRTRGELLLEREMEEGVNEFYGKNRRVEIWKLGKRCGKRVWDLTTFLAALLLLLFFFFHIVVDIFRYPPGSGGAPAVTRSFTLAGLLLPPGSSPSSSLLLSSPA